jgi:subtilisin family serine protease
MKNGRVLTAFAMLIGIFSMAIFWATPSSAADISVRKIVVFQSDFVNEVAQKALLIKHDAILIKRLKLINAMAVHLSPQAEEALRNRIEILRVDDDLVISKSPKPEKPGKAEPEQPPQELPWGVDRIGADEAWDANNTGETIKVAVVDTGIDLEHPDLIENIKGNFNAINPRKSGNDDNGHGSHVAGTIAALNNEIGVIGVGPEIYLYAVKVLDRKGSGWLSDLIEGLTWCINNEMQVVNMSLGASVDNDSFHEAITAVYNAGIVQVAAAGNNGENGGEMDYPAKYEETIAVSAVDEEMKLAGFSSWGVEVDLAAPGVGIKSTYKDAEYETLDGTSMATPHVSGSAALVLANNNNLNPDEVKDKLKETAENLQLEVSEQGAGLVRPDLAIQ